MLTETFLTLRRTSEVGLTRIKWDVSVVLNQFIDSGVVSSVTGASLACTAVEYPLNGKVDVMTLALASNFNAVC